MSTDLFALANADDAEGLAKALPGTDLARLHNPAGESLYRFALFHGHAKSAEAVKAHGGLGSHDAALTNDAARLDVLLAPARWAVDLLSPDGWTALHLAAFVGADAAVTTLLALGANARIMGRAFEQNLAIHAAAAGRRIGKAAYAELIAATGDPDVMQKQGYTALMIAASNGFTPACEALIAADADRRLKLPDGKTAADIARERGHADLAAMLA
ncbi:MAG: ankyrin repeat domain-containing protein [Proteobacteria bacterium]|nr:ankyrin repeat domain-containing protein [Pseudomonadota bacterium]